MTRFAMAAAWLALAPVALVAQSAAPETTAGVWHAAVDAREALRAPAPSEDDILRAVKAELTLGRPDRALRVLEQHRPTAVIREGDVVALDAAGAYGSGDFGRAGELYAAAARYWTGEARGLLSARAGDAFERAGQQDSATTYYRAARALVGPITGWLALREARVQRDTAEAFRLVEQAPLAGRQFVPRVRGEVLATAGDTVRAVVVLAAASLDGRAATLALAGRDSAGARQLAYRAMRAGDTAVANVGVALARTVFPPAGPLEMLVMARAVRRPAPAEAADLVGRAVAAGDVSAATLVLWGDVLSDARKYDAALAAYTRAAALTGTEAVAAEFSRARTLIRLGRPVAARAALGEFNREHPTHASAPVASFLLADLTQDAGRRAEADSLFGAVIARWPRSDYASQARFRLAGGALARRDTARAADWYRTEVEARGGQRAAARYFLAQLASARGDSATAVDEWAALADLDSLGYYGMLARAEAGLPDPSVAGSSAGDPSGELQRHLVELDLLDELGFREESAAVVGWLVAREQDAEEALDLAEALVERGRPVQGIQLGWHGARTRTMNHPRVLRAIYPWPLRDVVHAEAAEFGLDPYLLAALIRQESSFDPLALSRAGARGLMQIMPATARQAARRLGLDWSDQLLRIPDANIHVGAAHFASLLRHYRGEVVPALAAYNAGLTPVERWRRRFAAARDPALFVERIPYAETRGYVRSVLRNWAIYRALYPPPERS